MVLSSMQLQKVSVTLWFRRLRSQNVFVQKYAAHFAALQSVLSVVSINHMSYQQSVQTTPLV